MWYSFWFCNTKLSGAGLKTCLVKRGKWKLSLCAEKVYRGKHDAAFLVDRQIDNGRVSGDVRLSGPLGHLSNQALLAGWCDQRDLRHQARHDWWWLRTVVVLRSLYSVSSGRCYWHWLMLPRPTDACMHAPRGPIDNQPCLSIHPAIRLPYWRPLHDCREALWSTAASRRATHRWIVESLDRRYRRSFVCRRRRATIPLWVTQSAYYDDTGSGSFIIQLFACFDDSLQTNTTRLSQANVLSPNTIFIFIHQ